MYEIGSADRFMQFGLGRLQYAVNECKVRACGCPIAPEYRIACCQLQCVHLVVQNAGICFVDGRCHFGKTCCEMVSKTGILGSLAGYILAVDVPYAGAFSFKCHIRPPEETLLKAGAFWGRN